MHSVVTVPNFSIHEHDPDVCVRHCYPLSLSQEVFRKIPLALIWPNTCDGITAKKTFSHGLPFGLETCLTQRVLSRLLQTRKAFKSLHPERARLGGQREPRFVPLSARCWRRSEYQHQNSTRKSNFFLFAPDGLRWASLTDERTAKPPSPFRFPSTLRRPGKFLIGSVS